MEFNHGSGVCVDCSPPPPAWQAPDADGLSSCGVGMRFHTATTSGCIPSANQLLLFGGVAKLTKSCADKPLCELSHIETVTHAWSHGQTVIHGRISVLYCLYLTLYVLYLSFTSVLSHRMPRCRMPSSSTHDILDICTVLSISHTLRVLRICVVFIESANLCCHVEHQRAAYTICCI